MSFFFSQEMFVYFIAVFQHLCIYKENNLFSYVSYMISGTFQFTDNGAEFPGKSGNYRDVFPDIL